MSVKICPEKFFDYFDGSSGWHKAGKLHSVCIARCICYIKNFVRWHSFGSKRGCEKCQLIELFIGTLSLRKHSHILTLIKYRNKGISRKNYLLYSDENVSQIVHVPKNFKVDLL